VLTASEYRTGVSEGKPTFFPFRVAVLCMGEYSTPEEVYEAFQAGESLDVEDIELLNEHPDMKSRASSSDYSGGCTGACDPGWCTCTEDDL